MAELRQFVSYVDDIQIIPNSATYQPPNKIFSLRYNPYAKFENEGIPVNVCKRKIAQITILDTYTGDKMEFLNDIILEMSKFGFKKMEEVKALELAKLYSPAKEFVYIGSKETTIINDYVIENGQLKQVVTKAKEIIK